MHCNICKYCNILLNILLYVHLQFVNKNNGRVAFIGIVIYNHFVLPMSLLIDFDVLLPKPGSFFSAIFGSAAFAVTKR